MSKDPAESARLRWARLRFSIVGSLLHSPASPGELSARIAELAARSWDHPTTNEPTRFSAKSVERWYYLARRHENPFDALARKVPSHAGKQRTLPDALVTEIRALRSQHPCWSAQLLYDNLKALADADSLGPVPSYSTVARFLKNNGLGKRRRPRRHELQPDFVAKERRLFEVGHVHGLWHCDFHKAKRKVVAADGSLQLTTLLAVLDDRSRLCCHAQWYLGDGDTADFVHGLCQAFAKRGLPRALLSDNGGPMTAAETEQGLERLSIVHHTTLSQSPEQNGKQEVFFSQIEGRLMPMLEGERGLTLELLNRATQAWVEEEYQRHLHSETKQSPLDRLLAGPSVGRPCPSSEDLRRAFRMQKRRKQRRSDGTVTVERVRYEVPAAYRTLIELTVRCARWDLSNIDLVDPRRGTHLATLYPVDREKNAERRRRTLVDPTAANDPMPVAPPPGIAPLLKKLMADYAATGLPPAYIPFDRTIQDHSDKDEEP